MTLFRFVQTTLLAGALLGGACAGEAVDDITSSSSAILGGTGTHVGDFPSVVAILIDGPQGGLCTGTLIAQDLVMTAAHCTEASELGYSSQEEAAAATTVVLDSVDLFGGAGREVPVLQTMANPGFFQPGDPDVGLIRLAQKVTDRTPSRVNLVHEDAPVGTKVTQVGYGMTEVGDTSSAGYQYVLKDKLTSSCGAIGASDGRFICYNQFDGTGTCSGDSGGPQFATINGVQKVVAVTSFGDLTCEEFGGAMRVDAAVDYLLQNQPNLNACTADEDCGAATDVCAGSACVTGPDQPRGLGTECSADADCDTGPCADGPGDGKLCTAVCDPDQDNQCPDGFECLDAGDTGACWPEQGGGGCSAGPRGRGAGTGGLLLLTAFGLMLSRRRRRARRT